MTDGAFIVHRGTAPPTAALAGAVVAIGNFDGVHRGHRAVIPAALPPARPLGGPEALAAGSMEEANAFLGYPCLVSGEVVHGDKRGGTFGYPTANLRLDPACGLRHGIYAVRVGAGGQRHGGVASFGRRPTFDA